MQQRDKFAALLVIAIWGINFYFMKLGIEEIDPLLLGCLRFLLVVFPFIFWLKRPQVSWKLLLLYGLISNFAQFAFMFSAIATGLPTGLIALIVQSQAFFTVLIAVFCLGEKARPNEWLAILVAIIGFICIGIGQQHSYVPMLGLFLVLGSALSWALGNIVVKKIGRTDPFALVVWGNLFTPVWFLLFAYYQNDMEYIRQNIYQLSWQVWLSAGFLAYFATIIGYGLWVKLLAKYPASQVTPLSLGVPVISLLFGIVLLQERLNFYQWLGVVIVASALVIHLFGRNLFCKKS
ncbi:EamA family transporter [Volucribacter amazonae]|uniref:Amino acid transporter n=1 Tax=Volucribacter amazonae TaxID=256731 RepID=A0A9X4PAN3_9PAST|nr:EamA family transporter [Volucribacter amazonae]MDG6894174.1 amino acid transporter [Volucribacter amazonae]